MAAQEYASTGLVGRYATALFELADEAKQLDAVAEDLRQLKAMVAGSEDLRRVIASPLLARAQQAKAMTALLDQARVGDLTRRFVLLVARNRRLFALTQLADAYNAMLASRRGEVTAEVTSATPLRQDQVEALRGALQGAAERLGGRKVAVDLRVDPKLIGGLVIKLGSRLLDASLRTKLQRLQLAMKGQA